MKVPVFVLTMALLSFSAGAAAQTDCHQALKELLQGTLDLEREMDNGQTGMSPDVEKECTLASGLNVQSSAAVS